MYASISSLIFSSVLGCALHRGDSFSEVGDWSAAYEEYALATHRRPGSVRAQQRLHEARAQVMGLFEADLAQRLERKQFEAAGDMLTGAARFSPPPEWLREQHARTREALSAHLQAGLSQDGALATAQAFRTISRALPSDMDTASLVAAVCSATSSEVAQLIQQQRFSEAVTLLDGVSSALPGGTGALRTERDALVSRWHSHLMQQSTQSGRAGNLGGAVVFAAGAGTLSSSGPSQRDQLWQSLVDQEWGGVYLQLRGPSSHREFLRAGLTERWAASPWRDGSIGSRRPGQPHLSVAVSVTEAQCTQATINEATRRHSYRDGTYVSNPAVAALEAELRHTAQELSRREAAVDTAAHRRDMAAVALQRAQRAVEAQRPPLRAAEASAAEAERRQQAATEQLEQALSAQAQLQEREREVQALLDQRAALTRRGAQLRREHRAAQDRLAAAEAAQQSSGRNLQQATAALESANAEVARLQQARRAAQEALDGLPGERARLQQAQQAGQANIQALQSARDQAKAALRLARASRAAIEEAQAPLAADLTTAEAAQQAARDTLAAAKAAAATNQAAQDRTDRRVKQLTDALAAATDPAEQEDLRTRLSKASRRQEVLQAEAADLEGALAQSREAVSAAQADVKAARDAIASAGDLPAARERESAAERALAGAKQAIEAARAEQSARAEALAGLEAEEAAATRALAEARRALGGAEDAAHRAKQAHQSAAEAARPLRAAAEAAQAQATRLQAAVDELSREEATVQGRLSQLETELRVLGASVDLLPARRAELGDAQRVLSRAQGRLEAEKRRMAPLRKSLRAAEVEREAAGMNLSDRTQERDAQGAAMRRLESKRATVPEQVELVKEAAYRAKTWERTCRLTAQVSVQGQATAGWDDTIRLELVEQDETWAARPEIALAADPLTFSAPAEEIIARQRAALQASVWQGIQEQMPQEAAARRGMGGRTLEEETRMLLVAHWMQPSDDLRAFVQGRYDLPAVSWEL